MECAIAPNRLLANQFCSADCHAIHPTAAPAITSKLSSSNVPNESLPVNQTSVHTQTPQDPSLIAWMFPRPSSFIRQSTSSIRLIQNPCIHRSVSLGIFREKKVPPTPEKSTVPSIHHTGTSGAFYPPLKLHSAISARAKRDTRRLPIFPDGGTRWMGIRGDTAGDDAWVVGKYYLGTIYSRWICCVDEQVLQMV